MGVDKSLARPTYRCILFDGENISFDVSLVYIYIYMCVYTYIYNGYSALGPVWQEPEPSQATGMALIRCILGKFLGVVWNCFPPRLDVPAFAARCLHILNDARDPSQRWNYGREMSGNFAYLTSKFTPLGIFYTPQIYDMGPTALLPLRRKACSGFFRN